MVLVGGFIFAVLGAWLTALNFYLSVLRYPVHRLLHSDQTYKWISGVSLFGSLFLWVAALLLWWQGQPHWATALAILSLFDTGGLHWFVVTMIYHAFTDKA